MAIEKFAYQPDLVTPPGYTMAELLEEHGLTPLELAQRLDQPLKTINEIIHGRRAVTTEIAMQMERVFGVPVAFWLKREGAYQEYLARQAD